MGILKDIFSGESTSEYVKILKGTDLFGDLSEAEIERISKYFRHTRYKAGDVIFQEGKQGDVMYVIRTGAVDVVKRLEDGTDKVLASLVDGSLFGELAILDESERSATVVARAPVEMMELYRASLLELMKNEPRIAVKVIFQLARLVGEKLRDSGDRMKTVFMQRASAK